MEINTETKIIGVIGNPIKHSKSPLIHNAALEEKKLNYKYFAFEVEDIKKAIDGMKALGIVGFSVTIPHKVSAMELVDEVDVLAKKMGAINTIHNKDGKLFGYNTDCFGAINALKEKTSLAGKKVYLLGAGGAARAIVAGLTDEKANIKLFNKEVERAKKLAEEFKCEYGTMEQVDNACEILINATPIGMHPNINDSIFPKEMIKKDILVFDVVYNPLETKLIKDAKEKGCITVQGIEMFLEQAYAQFRIFTGEEPPKEVMRKVLINELTKEQSQLDEKVVK